MKFCKNNIKLLLVAILLLVVGFLFIKYHYQKLYSVTAEECIKNSSPQNFKLVSENSFFDIIHIANSHSDCFNRKFPIIYINTNLSHNAWVHIIYTDSSDPNYVRFIDAPEEHMPFYTFQQEFQDAPLWNYSLFHKPINYWIGHAYPILRENNLIKIQSGVEWGFNLYRFLGPRAIKPKIIELKDYEQDKEILEKALGNFYIII